MSTRSALHEAIEAHLRASNGMPPEEELGDFIVVAVGVAIDKDFHPTARYYTTFRDDTMLPHVARGLLAKGEDVLIESETAAEEEDG